MRRSAGKMSDVTSNRLDFGAKRADKAQPACDYSSLTCATGPFDS